MDFFIKDKVAIHIYRMEKYHGLDFINYVYEFKSFLNDNHISKNETDDEFIDYEQQNTLKNSIRDMHIYLDILTMKNNFEQSKKRLPTIEELFKNYYRLDSLSISTDLSINMFRTTVIDCQEIYYDFFLSHAKLMLPTIWKNQSLNPDLVKLIRICGLGLEKAIKKLVFNFRSSDDYFQFVLDDSIFKNELRRNLIVK